ncbi:MAG TPA: glycosyltransferase family 4 protein [Xanthobacteraceae bacterium]|jgi:UDP-glucose:(heptosyl)LPS alpha-1,3-glucosyltransferase
MRFALAVVKLFPWGGVQRDCLRLARALQDRGHEATIFTSSAEGPLPADTAIEILPARALTNHGRNRRFSDALARAVKGRYQCVVGFDKLSSLDILYCVDPSVSTRAHNLLGWFPRRRTLLALEAASFVKESRTRIIGLSQILFDEYRRAWGTPAERFTLLPPNIDVARRRPYLRTDGTRERLRRTLGLSDEFALLSICVQPEVKGVDRTIDALVSLPAALLLVAGVDPGGARARRIMEIAGANGVAERVRLLGPREGISELMAASDLFVHPARLETTGAAILEAVVNGLPQVTSARCGYALHVQRADVGIVLEEPFSARALEQALAVAADPARRAQWSANGIAYGADPELYRGIERAAEFIIADAAR